MVVLSLVVAYRHSYLASPLGPPGWSGPCWGSLPLFLSSSLPCLSLSSSVCLSVFLFLSGGASASSVLASPLVLWGRPCGSPCLVCPWGLGESGIIVDDDEDVLEVRWLLPLAQGFASFQANLNSLFVRSGLFKQVW